MRPVFHKFLKFRKFCKNFKETEVYGWSRQILKKQKTTLPELSTPVIRPRYDPQLNCSIGGILIFTRQLSAWMDVFLSTTRRDRSQCKIFLIFTLHWLYHSQIKRDRAEFCLIDPIVRQVWLLTAIARPAPYHQNVCKKR